MYVFSYLGGSQVIYELMEVNEIGPMIEQPLNIS